MFAYLDTRAFCHTHPDTAGVGPRTIAAAWHTPHQRHYGVSYGAVDTFGLHLYDAPADADVFARSAANHHSWLTDALNGALTSAPQLAAVKAAHLWLLPNSVDGGETRPARLALAGTWAGRYGTLAVLSGVDHRTGTLHGALVLPDGRIRRRLPTVDEVLAGTWGLLPHPHGATVDDVAHLWAADPSRVLTRQHA